MNMLMDMSDIYALMDGLPPGAWVAISTEKRQVLSYGDDALKVFCRGKGVGGESSLHRTRSRARRPDVFLGCAISSITARRFDLANKSDSRPMVDLILLAPNGESIQIPALLDSGADFCLFPLDAARVLGLDLRNLPHATTVGVGNLPNLTYFSDLTINLGDGVIFDSRVGFTAGMNSAGFGLLGQQGFFENYNVEFRHRDRIFTIEPA